MRTIVHFPIKHRKSGMRNIFEIKHPYAEDQPFLRLIYFSLSLVSTLKSTKLILVLRQSFLFCEIMFIFFFKTSSLTLCQNDKYLRLHETARSLKFSARFNPTVFLIALLSLLLCTIYARCITIKFNAPRLRLQQVRAIRVGKSRASRWMFVCVYRSIASHCEKKKWITAENLIRTYI